MTVVRFSRVFLFWSFLSILLSLPTAATPNIRIDPPPREVKEGQLFFFRIYCEWPQSDGNLEIALPDIAPVNLELIRHSESQETLLSENGPLIRYILTYEFKGMAPGEGKIPFTELRYRISDQPEWASLPILPQKVMITHRPLAARIFGWIALGTALGGCFVAFLRLKKRFSEKRAGTHKLPVDPRQTVYIQAENSITSFQDAGVQEKLSHWSHQLKRVVQTYYDIPPSSATEPEILQTLRSRNLQAGEIREVETLFQRVTALKFSGDRIPLRELENLQKTLLQYVRGKIIIENPQS